MRSAAREWEDTELHPAVFVILAALTLIFAYTGNIVAAGITGIVLAVYFLSPFLRTLIGIPKAVLTGTASTLKSEEGEMDKASPKPPKGKEFIEKGLENIGKDLGKAEKAKIRHKKIGPKHKESFEAIGTAAGDLLEGIKKLFRR